MVMANTDQRLTFTVNAPPRFSVSTSLEVVNPRCTRTTMVMLVKTVKTNTTRLTFTVNAPTRELAIVLLALATASLVTKAKAAPALPALTTATATVAAAQLPTSTLRTLHGIFTTPKCVHVTQDTVVLLVPSVTAQKAVPNFLSHRYIPVVFLALRLSGHIGGRHT